MTDEEFSLIEQEFYDNPTNETAANFLEAGLKYFIPSDSSVSDFEFEVIDSITAFLRKENQ